MAQMKMIKGKKRTIIKIGGQTLAFVRLRSQKSSFCHLELFSPPLHAAVTHKTWQNDDSSWDRQVHVLL
jgi:hypothetical protein